MKGQITISVDPLTFVKTGTPSETDVAYHINVTNTSNQTIELFWSVRVNDNLNNWDTWICDKNLCYVPQTFICPPSKPNEIEPGGVMDISMHINPANKTGSSEYDLSILDGNGNVLSVINGTFLIGTTAVKDLNETKLTVYPNPTQDFFQVSDTPGLRYIELFNIVGSKMKSFNAIPQKQYYVGDLTDGIYLVRLVTSSGKIIKTIRLSKR